MLTLILVLALTMGALLTIDVLRSERAEARAYASWAMPVTQPLTWYPKALTPARVAIDPTAEWLNVRPAPRHRAA